MQKQNENKNKEITKLVISKNHTSSYNKESKIQIKIISLTSTQTKSNRNKFFKNLLSIISPLCHL